MWLEVRPRERGLRTLRTMSRCRGWGRLPREQPPLTRGGHIWDRVLPVEILSGIISCDNQLIGMSYHVPRSPEADTRFDPTWGMNDREV